MIMKECGTDRELINEISMDLCKIYKLPPTQKETISVII